MIFDLIEQFYMSNRNNAMVGFKYSLIPCFSVDSVAINIYRL
jgi:hypothetical protein